MRKLGEERCACARLARTALLVGTCVAGTVAWAAEGGRYAAKQLVELSLEELANIEIISAAKRPQKLREAASSIYVITRQDILHAGATTLAEALRLAPNLQVARQTASQYAISARGFNSTTANKLLVLIDGRSVYTPLFSGVFWDVQDTLLEDIDRIEVISGPGATLWGANAVNGVINVVTRQAGETVGSLAVAQAGTRERGAAVRHGGKLPGDAAWRVYGKVNDLDGTDNAAGASMQDAWRIGQGGFRYDRKSGAEGLTLQGDAYSGSSRQPVFDRKTFEGANILGRWTRRLGAASDLQLQAYYDYTRRVYPGIFGETLHTVDIEGQHALRLGWHEVVWGAGYRFSDDSVQNSALLAFLPPHRTFHTANAFVQDDIQLIAGRLNFIIGAKLEHNSFSGYDFQPNLRLSWKASERHHFWGAISRAARAPSRIDADFFAALGPGQFLAGGPNFASERLTAYELGWRGNNPSGSLSTTLFHHRYERLRNLEFVAPGVLNLTNFMSGEGSGIELWGEVRPRPTWRLQFGYTYLHKVLRLPPNSTDPLGTRAAGSDPPHQWSLRSSLELATNLDWDVALRRVGALSGTAIPAYGALDMRLAWKPVRHFELALIGRNLLDPRHAEFQSTPLAAEIGRSGLVKGTWAF